MGEPARILVVCTGNVCRSPLTERLLRARLSDRLAEQHDRIVVSSAGVRALVGSSMTAEAASELRSLGGDDTAFVSRQLTVDLVNGSDLVIAATRQHRAEAVTLAPRALGSAFTLRELHRLLRDVDLSGLPRDPADRLRELVTLARARRGLVPPAHEGDDDVTDPYGRSAQAYATTTRQIVPAVAFLVDALVA